MGKIRIILGVLAFGIMLLMGHFVALIEIYGNATTLEQILWLIPHYFLYLYYISLLGLVGWISYQLITKGYDKGLDRVLGTRIA